MRLPVPALALALAVPAAAEAMPPLQDRVEALLRVAGPGTRFGLVVAGEDGREIVSIAPEGRFIPASNTKLFTTAAAFAALDGLEGPDEAGGAAVRLERAGTGAPDVVLVGGGDARLSSRPDCVSNCLAVLADAVAAATRVVGDVVGDDSLFPDERWSPGMSWNNIQTRSGTAASALSLDDNELALRVSPTAPGKAPTVEGLAYYRIDNRAMTAAGGAAALDIRRLPGSDLVRLSGTIPAGAEPQTIRLGIDDPAHYAAWRLRALLEERGVRVVGGVATRHRAPGAIDDPALRGAAPPPRPPQPSYLARLTPPPLIADIAAINKASQNLHAEQLLRRIGREAGTGSVADGIAAVHSLIEGAGVPRAQYDLFDGSGMSTYNRLSPRGVAAFLRWAATQPWGAAWRGSFAVAGVDGTLTRRFAGTPLQGRLFAKTGSLNATSALSGYMIARSGRILTFSAFANDAPPGAGVTAAIDAALLAVAEAN